MPGHGILDDLPRPRIDRLLRNKDLGDRAEGQPGRFFNPVQLTPPRPPQSFQTPPARGAA